MHLQSVGRWKAKHGRDTALDRCQRAAKRRGCRDGRGEVALQRHSKIFNRNLPLSGVVQHSPLTGIERHSRIAPHAALKHVHHQLPGHLVELGKATTVWQ